MPFLLDLGSGTGQTDRQTDRQTTDINALCSNPIGIIEYGQSYDSQIRWSG